jgi:hypothetical protein
VDIREYVDYSEVVRKFGLGPNGALVASLDMATSYANELKTEIVDARAQYVLVDCPGQMELFAYRNSGPLMVNNLRGEEPALSLYLLDSNIAHTPTGYLASMLLGISINIRFGLPQLNVLSKQDILKEDQVQEIVDWSTDSYMLEEALDRSESGLLREYSGSILRMLDDFGGGASVIPVSAKQMSGMEVLYGEMQRIFAGGEDYVADW